MHAIGQNVAQPINKREQIRVLEGGNLLIQWQDRVIEQEISPIENNFNRILIQIQHLLHLSEGVPIRSQLISWSLNSKVKSCFITFKTLYKLKQ